MKKLFLLIILMSLAMAGHAENLIYYQDSTATDTLKMVPVSTITPLPTTVLTTIGTASVDPATPPTENSMTIVSATSSPQDVTSLVNRRSVTCVNQSGTVTGWVSLDSTVASAAVGIGIPLPPHGAFSTELDSDKIVGVAADGVASITVYQDGY